MNNQLQTLIKKLKKNLQNRVFNEFGEIPRIWRIDSFQKSKFR